MTTEENPQNGSAKQGYSQVIVTYDPEAATITIGGKTRNLLEALSMLTRATHEIEFRWRNARA